MAKDFASVSETRNDAERYFSAGRFQQALDTYKLIKDQGEKDPKIYLRMGDISRKLSNQGGAVKNYRLAATAFAKRGIIVKAIAVCKMIINIDPSQEGVEDDLAKLYSQRKPVEMTVPKEFQEEVAAGAPAANEPASALRVEGSSTPASPVSGADSENSESDTDDYPDLTGGVPNEEFESMADPFANAGGDSPQDLTVGTGQEGPASTTNDPLALSSDSDDSLPDLTGGVEQEDFQIRDDPFSSSGSGDDSIPDLTGDAFTDDLIDGLSPSDFDEEISGDTASETPPEDLLGESIIFETSLEDPFAESETEKSSAPKTLLEENDPLRDLLGESIEIEGSAENVSFGGIPTSQGSRDDREAQTSDFESGPSIEDLAYEEEELNRTPLFSDLNPEELSSVIRYAQIHSVGKGEYVFKQGDDGGSIYVITSGAAEVLSHTKYEEEVRCANLMDGDFFGEFGYFSGAPRSSGVRALTELELIEFSRDALEGLTEKHPNLTKVLFDFYKERVLNRLLAVSKIFRHMAGSDRHEILKRVWVERFVADTDVLHKGDEGDAMYLIKSGKATVWSKREDGTKEILKELCEGDYFGEVALVENCKRVANVSSNSTLELVLFSRPLIEDIILKYPVIKSILAEEAKKHANLFDGDREIPESLT